MQGTSQTAERMQTQTGCLLAGFPWLVQPAFLSSTDPPATWAGPSHINQQSRNRPTEMPRGQPMESIPQLRFSLSEYVLICVTLTSNSAIHMVYISDPPSAEPSSSSIRRAKAGGW